MKDVSVHKENQESKNINNEHNNHDSKRSGLIKDQVKSGKDFEKNNPLEVINIKLRYRNLELKGDYYMINKLPEKALESYVEAMNSLKTQDFSADISGLQKKISKITNIGG